MTDQGSGLSRRDRRAMEARAAGSAPDATEQLETVREDPNPETSGLSRRDRRRIERAQRPLETWTVEEEMIATGQLPAMTPEVLAEQERLARQRESDAAAVASAEAASSTTTDDDQGESGPEATEPVIPVRESAFARAAEDDPGSDQPAHNDEAAPDVETADQFENDLPDTAQEPNEAAAEVVAEVSPSEDPGQQQVADAVAADDSTPWIPEAFRGMFPPGSLQAKAMAARREEQEATAPQGEANENHGEASSSSWPNTDSSAQQSVDAAEEIRRLTAAAMAGIEGSGARDAARVAVDEPVHEPVDEPADEPVHEPVDKPADEPVDESVEATVDEPRNAPSVQPVDEQSDDPAAALAPHHATFDSVIAPHSGELPVVERTIETEAPELQDNASIENPPVAPSIWDAHPLISAESQAREIADAPSQAIPRPDFSALAPATNPEHPAPFSPTAYSAGEAPMTTGSIEVARRTVPELHPAGGARHFRWAHIAVLGAIAFVLGVLVYNLSGIGS